MSLWHEFTWSEMADLSEERRTALKLLLVVGSVEQHGPHLPLGADFLYGEAIAKRVVEGSDDVVLLPSLPYGSVTAARDFPGSIPIRSSTLMTILIDIMNGLEKQGFHHLVVYASHGGNVPVVETAMKEFAECGGMLATYLIPAMDYAKPLIDEMREGEEWGHACEIETSVMLHLFPELVHMDRVCPGCVFAGFQEGPKRVGWNWKDICACGIHGEPHHASAEKGAAIVKALVEQTQERLSKIVVN
ncbi:MAG: creatininase family protein [Planctomycetota bacterium]|jgi:creatinine amidohydrolase